jgi:DNA helicase-2/ATP-dependent DNA helicase PcrA
LSIDVKNFEHLSDLEKLALVDFSYSRIDTYNSCAAKYFYSYVLKEPRQFNPPAVLGNIVHEVLENILDNDKELLLDELKDEYEKIIPEWDPDNRIPNDLIQVGRAILDEFYDEHSDKSFNIFDKEMSFDLVIGSYRIRGFIDRVDIIGNRVNIIDYKTGKWEVSLKEVPNNLQLGIYALAAANLFKDKEVHAELYYLRSGKRKGHTFSPDEIELVKQKVIDNINKIINDTNFTPTSNGRICSYCDHASSGACGIGAFRNRNRNR